MRRLLKDERGSVVVFLEYGLALAGGAFLYSVMSRVVNHVAKTTTASGPSWNFLLWSWEWLVPALLLFGVTLWFLASLQKRYYVPR